MYENEDVIKSSIITYRHKTTTILVTLNLMETRENLKAKLYYKFLICIILY
jgi:hypothetical protein